MIVPVKKIRLITPIGNQINLIRKVQELGQMMLDSGKELTLSSDDQQYLKRIEKYIDILEKKRKKKFFEYHEISFKEFLNIKEQAEVLLNHVHETVTDIENATKQNENNLEILNLLEPYQNLSIRLSDIDVLEKTRVFIGYMPLENYEYLLEKQETLNIVIEEINNDSENKYIAVASDINQSNKIKDTLKQYDFNEVNFPKLKSYVKDEVELLKDIIVKNEQIIKNSEDKLKNYSKNIDILKAFYDYEYNERISSQINFQYTESTCYVEGFLAEDELEVFSEKLNEDVETYIEVLENTEEVPTLTRNNKFVSQFETITNMYSVPNTKEIDPNPIMSIWYWLIFGIMMGDIGYGLLMILFFGLFVKYKRPKGELKKLSLVFAYSGVTSVLFGILFGSFFGTTFDLLHMIGKLFGNDNWSSIVLNPINEPLPMLIASLGIGALHIITALLIKIYLEVKRNNVYTALSEGLSWILILIGIVLFILVKPTIIGLALVIIGVLLILIFKGHSEKKLFGKVLSGLGGLYGVTNYLSDILSYSRILALSLSSAVIAFTMNMLGGMVAGGIIGFVFSIVIYIIGHVFNFAMGLLSAYVHDGRLQYLEFFGKFYEGGGTLFTPFAYELKYMDEIIKENK